MIEPIFYVEPGNEQFAPTPAHPGEDAGGDVRVFVEDYKKDALDAFLDEAQRACWSRPRGAKDRIRFFVDGTEYNLELYVELEHAKKKVEEAGGAVFVRPFGSVNFSAGFKVILPTAKELSPSLEGLIPVFKVVSRSGLAIKHRITVTNSPGIIDSGYRGFVRVDLESSREHYHVFTHGARIAQGLTELVVDPARAKVITDESLVSASARGAAGFGSTSV